MCQQNSFWDLQIISWLFCNDDIYKLFKKFRVTAKLFSIGSSLICDNNLEQVTFSNSGHLKRRVILWDKKAVSFL